MLAIALKDSKFTESIKAGVEYKVVKAYTCPYEGNERIVIQCEDGQRDCFAENFLIKTDFKKGEDSMLEIVGKIKDEIKSWGSDEVEIIVSNQGGDLYDTSVDVYYDENNGAMFVVGRRESYLDAIRRAETLNEELQYINPVIVVDNEAREGDTIIVEGETHESVVTGRYYEGGIEDNGVTYLNKDGIEFTTFDGCYQIVKRRD